MTICNTELLNEIKLDLFMVMEKLTSQQSRYRKVDRNRFLGDFVRACMEDVLEHVVVSGLFQKGLVGTAQKCTVTILKC